MSKIYFYHKTQANFKLFLKFENHGFHNPPPSPWIQLAKQHKLYPKTETKYNAIR